MWALTGGGTKLADAQRQTTAAAVATTKCWGDILIDYTHTETIFPFSLSFSENNEQASPHRTSKSIKQIKFPLKEGAYSAAASSPPPAVYVTAEKANEWQSLIAIDIHRETLSLYKNSVADFTVWLIDSRFSLSKEDGDGAERSRISISSSNSSFARALSGTIIYWPTNTSKRKWKKQKKEEKINKRFCFV